MPSDGVLPISHTCVLVLTPLPQGGILADSEIHRPLSFLLDAVQFDELAQDLAVS